MRLLIVASGARQWTDAAALQRRDAASPPRVARWGDLGRVSSGGPTTDSDGPGSDAGGVPAGRVAGSPVETGARPHAPVHRSWRRQHEAVRG
jgi:hypothetical protein